MALLQKLLDNKEELLKSEKQLRNTKIVHGSGSDSGTDDVLENDDEVERLSKYISERNRKKIINQKTAIKWGVNHIGDINDCEFFTNLKRGSSLQAKKQAANVLVRKWASENLKTVIKTKSGKEIMGKMVSKNIYIKKVSVTYTKGPKAGRTISYLQARSKLTGQVVKYSTASKLLARQ